MGLAARRSRASHTAASPKRMAKMLTEARFNLNERISGERPTDSIPLVKRRARVIRVPWGVRDGWTGGVERCMFDAFQLRTDALDLNFNFRSHPRHDANPS